MQKIVLGNESVVGSLTPLNKELYKVTNRIREGKEPLYGIVFNFIDSRFFNVFATVGGNRITLYNCLKGGDISVLQTYTDEDKEESFYTVSWACGIKGNPLVVAAGLKGIIRIIDVEASNKIETERHLVGHGHAINEIRTHPLKPQLVLTASKDESVRLWNVETGICVLIFSGAKGHRLEVISVDFHPSDKYRFASCGMDNTIKIWSMKEVWTHVENSYTWPDHPSTFPTKYVQYPLYTASIHNGFVDCNRWLGDFILSKGVENEMVLWEPKLKDNSPRECSSDVLLKYPIPKCTSWFIKFSCDMELNSVAIGNLIGEIYVWDLKKCPPELITKLSHKKSKKVIRQTAMSGDGRTILACSEDGRIWRWDMITLEQSESSTT